ncbi:LysM domain-containing protein 4 [Elsinoe fawcettii]|nr:LysM domain-containing protein 4 [Elsinoe fawcettii]
MQFISVIAASVALVSSVSALAAPLDNGALQRRQVCNGTVTLDPRVQETTVKQGDTLTSISIAFNRGICDIAKANNITNPNLIILGQKLIIPAQVCFPDNTTCLPPPAPTARAECVLGGPNFYFAKEKDTFDSIASSLNLTTAAFQAANDGNHSIAGFLNVPVCPQSVCTIGPYTIQSGDLFFDLARKFQTTFGQIIALNPTVNPEAIEVGTVITAPRMCQNGTIYIDV